MPQNRTVHLMDGNLKYAGQTVETFFLKDNEHCMPTYLEYIQMV